MRNKIINAAAALPTLTWRQPDGNLTSATAKEIATLTFEPSFPIRVGNRYPRQRNYHGEYYVASCRKHVPHESLLEASILEWLDFEGELHTICAQPAKLDFSDGSVHFPDFFAVKNDGSQWLVDVKPARRIRAEVVDQFSMTRELCKALGWGYAVYTELDEQVKRNVHWLAQYKHPGYHPHEGELARLNSTFIPGMPLKSAAASLGCDSLARGRSAVFHLMWLGHLETDLSQPLGDPSPLSRGRHA